MSALRNACVAALLLAAAGSAAAEVNVIIYSDVKPGVYGRVDFGGGPRPPLVYTNPMVVVQPPRSAPRPEPLYLHVPPGHAKNWGKHCKKYDACRRPVYFVMSDEYKPKKPKKPKKDKD